MPARDLLLALLTLTFASRHALAKREKLSVVVGVSGPEQPDPPFVVWEGPAAENSTYGFAGFLAPLLDALCHLGDLECSVEPFPEFSDIFPAVANLGACSHDRIFTTTRTALACPPCLCKTERLPRLPRLQGTIDFALDSLSVTPERSRLVEFVHPYFYSAGVALYAPRTMGDVLAAGGGWDALEGERVCVVDGYYAAGALVKAYGIVPVAVPDTAAAAAAVQAGACDAYAYDSGLPLRADMPQAAGLAPVLTAPYGIPVQRGNAELWDRLSAALVRLMMDGSASPMLQWEQQYITDGGALSDPQLSAVVRAISSFH